MRACTSSPGGGGSRPPPPIPLPKRQSQTLRCQLLTLSLLTWELRTSHCGPVDALLDPFHPLLTLLTFRMSWNRRVFLPIVQSHPGTDYTPIHQNPQALIPKKMRFLLFCSMFAPLSPSISDFWKIDSTKKPSVCLLTRWLSGQAVHWSDSVSFQVSSLAAQDELPSKLVKRDILGLVTSTQQPEWRPNIPFFLSRKKKSCELQEFWKWWDVSQVSFVL